MLLLDSQVVIWHLEGNPRVGSHARDLIEESPAVHVSAASVWELSIKNVIGKLELPARFLSRLVDVGVVLLPVTPEQAENVRTLPDSLRRHDPFDRLLVAQARALGLTFLTADRVLLALDLPFVVDATR